MGDAERKARAAARLQSATLLRTRLSKQEQDLSPISGADAISLVDRLTRESWSAAGRDIPEYARSEIRVRFVAGRLT
jgi:hypothetical protein